MSAAPTPSLFDEGLARRLDTLLTAVGALLLAGIELAALVDGERIKTLFMLEVFGLSLLAFAGLLRFSRSPSLAALSTLLVLVLSARVSWFEGELPTELMPIALGLLSSLFLLHARLPRAVVVALIVTALSLAVLLILERGTFSTLVLYAFIGASARSRPAPEPQGTTRWRGGRRWWSVLLVALAMMFVLGAYNLLREPLELFSRPLFRASIFFGTVATLVWLLAWWMLLRSMDGLRHSTFWSAIRVGLLIQAILVAILLGLQLYDLGLERSRWPPYLAAGHAFTFLIIIRILPLAVLCVLSGARPGRRGRLPWHWLLLAAEGLTVASRTVILAFDLDRTAPEVVVTSGLLSAFGLVTMWGLMRSVHETLADTSMADVFSSDAATPETRSA